MPGDKILVHGEYSADQAIITLTERDITSDGKTCYISVDGVAPYIQEGVESQYYVAYPGELVKNDKRCREKNKFTTSNALLMSGYQVGEEFIFEYLVSGLAFTVDGDFDSYVIKGNNNEIIGNETITCKVTETTKQYIQSKGADKKELKGTVVADGSTVNYICFPSDINLTTGFELTFFKGDVPVQTLYSEEVYSLTRGNFASLGNITANLNGYKAPIADTHVSEIPTAGAVNLSAVETSNCYIVTTPGTYSFKAVKGNSTEPIASIGSVEILWETWNTTEQVSANSVIAQVDFQKDVVYFRVADNFHYGNAVIAAKDERGNISWSWHIWIPETAITEDFHKLSKRKVMSRNLGALVDASADGASVKSVGMLYQWGRKDPFVGVADFSTGTPATVAGEQMIKAGGQLTTANSIKSPTSFADFKGNWNETSEEFWGTEKTIYDPCPAGYRVPYGSEFLPVSYGPDELEGYVYNSANNVFSVGTPATVFPLGGYLSTNGTYAGYGDGGYVWSARGSGASGYGFSLSAGEPEPAYSNATKQTANGYSVRCVSTEHFPFENAPGTPVKGGYTEYTVNVQELSGLCLNNDKSFLWGVGDQGNLVKLDFEGNVTKVLSKGYDMESVTMNPTTGDLYLGCEPNYVYKVLAPDYQKTEEIFRIQEASSYGNSGIEGISWYKDDMLLVGTQVGAYMWACKLDGTIVWRKCMKTAAIGLLEIADICYDPVRDQIWIICSETQSIYLFNGDATEHLATYKVNYGGNCESIYLDYNNNCVWIADDDSTSKLFRIDFTF